MDTTERTSHVNEPVTILGRHVRTARSAEERFDVVLAHVHGHLAEPLDLVVLAQVAALCGPTSPRSPAPSPRPTACRPRTTARSGPMSPSGARSLGGTRARSTSSCAPSSRSPACRSVTEAPTSGQIRRSPTSTSGTRPTAIPGPRNATWEVFHSDPTVTAIDDLRPRACFERPVVEQYLDLPAGMAPGEIRTEMWLPIEDR